jgi:hypothetical protein
VAARPRSGALGIFVVALGVVGVSYLGLRAMKRAEERGRDAADVGTTAPTRDPNAPLVPAIPSDVIDDAGKTPVARIDLVLRVDGVAVSAEGAPVCRSNNRSTIGRAPDGPAGSFDEGALQACVMSVLAQMSGKAPVATITRAGPAVPVEWMDALSAAVKRIGLQQVIVQP